MRQIVDAAGRKQQPVRRHVESGRVGDRRHFDRGFGAVEKRVEHLRVHAGRLRFARRQPVMAPDAIRRHVVIGRQIFGALAGGDDAKARRARPVHHLGGQRRLVAIGERIDHAGLARFLRQQRPGQHVGLDIDHDDMLARRNRRAGMPDADGGIAGGLHHDVHRAARNRARAVIGEGRSRDPRRASQPTVRHASRARSRSRSTMTDTSSPGVCGTCDRNIEPNFPAPISATRTGLPAAARALRR